MHVGCFIPRRGILVAACLAVRPCFVSDDISTTVSQIVLILHTHIP